MKWYRGQDDNGKPFHIAPINSEEALYAKEAQAAGKDDEHIAYQLVLRRIRKYGSATNIVFRIDRD